MSLLHGLPNSGMKQQRHKASGATSAGQHGANANSAQRHHWAADKIEQSFR